MKFIVKCAVAAIVILVSFCFGQYQAKLSLYKKLMLTHFTLHSLETDRSMELYTLKRIYEGYDDREYIERFIVERILLMYKDDHRIRDLVTSEDYGSDNGILITNQEVVKFLREHGLSECKFPDTQKLIDCHLSILRGGI